MTIKAAIALVVLVFVMQIPQIVAYLRDRKRHRETIARLDAMFSAANGYCGTCQGTRYVTRTFTDENVGGSVSGPCPACRSHDTRGDTRP